MTGLLLNGLRRLVDDHRIVPGHADESASRPSPIRLIQAAARPHSSMPKTVVTPAGATDQLSRQRAGRPRRVPAGVARAPRTSKIAASCGTPRSSLGADQLI